MIPHELSKACDEMVRLIGHVRHPVERLVYCRELADRLGLPVEEMAQMIAHTKGSIKAPDDAPAPPPPDETDLVDVDARFFATVLPLARARVAEWGAEDEMAELMGKIDPNGEGWWPEVEWIAFEVVRDSRALSLDEYVSRYGKPSWLLELEAL